MQNGPPRRIPDPPPPSAMPKMIDYPFPLGDQIASLVLPRELGKADAKRLCTFIKALAK